MTDQTEDAITQDYQEEQLEILQQETQPEQTSDSANVELISLTAPTSTLNSSKPNSPKSAEQKIRSNGIQLFTNAVNMMERRMNDTTTPTLHGNGKKRSTSPTQESSTSLPLKKKYIHTSNSSQIHNICSSSTTNTTTKNPWSLNNLRKAQRQASALSSSLSELLLFSQLAKSPASKSVQFQTSNCSETTDPYQKNSRTFTQTQNGYSTRPSRAPATSGEQLEQVKHNGLSTNLTSLLSSAPAIHSEIFEETSTMG